MKRDVSDKEDITIGIKKDSEKKECEDIGSREKWTKNCPKCKEEQIYASYNGLQRSIKRNQICNKCSAINKRLPVTSEELKRNCPKCNTVIEYTSKYIKAKLERKNKLCKRCSRGGFIPNGVVQIISHGVKKWLGHCSNCNKELIAKSPKNFKDHKLCRSCSSKNGWNRNRSTIEDKTRNCPKCNKQIIYGRRYDKTQSDKNKSVCRNCVSENNKGSLNSSKRKEVRIKLRLAAIKRVSKSYFNGHQLSPFFNQRACHFIDEYGKRCGYNFQHAMNGGEFFIKELGYWVDGYDKDKNTVFEYDESHHYAKKSRKQKDIYRMNEIKQHLGCKFIRYNEKLNEVKEY